MSGHSKWAQIKRQKAVTDAVKSRQFARFARLITVESKKAEGNLSSPGLVAAINRAKEVNMPKENIERAIAKGASKDAAQLDRVVYEVYGPAGVAIIIDAFTDNKNRTTQELKHILSQFQIELSPPGAASWAFTKQSDGMYVPNEPLIEVSGENEEQLSKLLEVLDEHEDVQRVFTNGSGYEDTGD